MAETTKERTVEQLITVGMVLMGFTFAWAAFEVDTLLLKILCWLWVACTALSISSRPQLRGRRDG